MSRRYRDLEALVGGTVMLRSSVPGNFLRRDKLDLYLGPQFCFWGHCAIVVQLYSIPLVEHKVFNFKKSFYLLNVDHEGPGELEIS